MAQAKKTVKKAKVGAAAAPKKSVKKAAMGGGFLGIGRGAAERRANRQARKQMRCYK